MKNEKLQAYASYFASYLLKNFEVKKINNIILFGSAARKEATRESDIDLFIEVDKKTKLLERKIKSAAESFYKSRDGLIFKMEGIDNKINIIVGKLKEWPDLKKGIENEGLVLYGHYVSSGIKGKKYLIISWDKIEKNRGAFLNKIYGFRVAGKEYKGLVEKFSGRKIGKSSVMIPVENFKYFEDLLRKYKVNARIVEVYA